MAEFACGGSPADRDLLIWTPLTLPRRDMSTAVVQGSSGGLGIAFTRHLLKNTSLKVYALTRSSAQQLEERLGGKHDRLTVLDGVDVREEDAIEKAAGRVKERERKSDVRLLACFAGVVSRHRLALTSLDPS